VRDGVKVLLLCASTAGKLPVRVLTGFKQLPGRVHGLQVAYVGFRPETRPVSAADRKTVWRLHVGGRFLSGSPLMYGSDRVKRYIKWAGVNCRRQSRWYILYVGPHLHLVNTRGRVVVRALCYGSEGRGFETR
jgi:hypothetical protein